MNGFQILIWEPFIVWRRATALASDSLALAAVAFPIAAEAAENPHGTLRLLPLVASAVLRLPAQQARTVSLQKEPPAPFVGIRRPFRFSPHALH